MNIDYFPLDSLDSPPVLPAMGDDDGGSFPGGMYKLHHILHPPLSEGCAFLIRCKCSVGCSGRCKCHKNGMRCTSLCNCQGMCLNNE